MAFNYAKFFAKRFKVVNKEAQIVPFEVNPIQQKFLSLIGNRDIILKARQQGFCLDPHTPILTASLEWKPIKDVQVGEELIATDEGIPGGRGRGRKMRTCTVEARNTTRGMAYEITMQSGHKLIATKEHRFLTKAPSGAYKTWREVGRLKPGYYVRYVARPWGSRSMEDAWVGGVIDGEAHFRVKSSGGVEMSIHQVDNALWTELVQWVNKHGYECRINWDIRGHRADKPVGSVTFNRLNEMFEIIGRTRPVRHLHKYWWEGKSLPGKRNGLAWDKIVSIKPVGERGMIDLQTSTKTFIANGYVSHNSTLVGGLFTADFLLRENILCMVIADDTDNAKGLLEKVKFFIQSYEEITGVKVPLKYNSKYELHNEAKNSKYIIGTAQSGAVGRSKTINNLHLSEAAFYRNMSDILTGALQAVPENGRVIIETTANGFNEFKNFWDEAVLEQNGFNPLFFPASDFYDKQFLRQKSQELGRLYMQEYPETPEEAFVTSGETYFNKEALTAYMNNVRKPINA